MTHYIAKMAMLVAGTLLGQAANAAADGQSTYVSKCSGCHGQNLQGAFAVTLKGDAFKARWDGRVDALRTFIATQMPPGQAGTLSAAEYDAVTAHLVKENKLSASAPAPAPAAQAVPAGGGDLASGNAAGGAIGGGRPDDAQTIAERARRADLLKAMRPVSEEMLRTPPPGDWINWRRTDDVQGYSPLKQINRRNVGKLGLTWSLALAAGTNQISPLVHDGIIFVNSAGTVEAIEGATGTVLWRYRREAAARPLGPPTTQPRGMAIYGSTLFVPTFDNRIIALDATTGKLKWEHLIEQTDGILRPTGAPIVVRGKVLQGVSGCAGAYQPGGCFIVGLDAADGHEIWRFNTIAMPGEPGGNSWGDAAAGERFGGSVWTPGSYDAGTGLVYFGTGQTYKITPLLRARPDGTTHDALYTDTTLALDPDTGKLVWHYQHMRGDIWDLDWSYERTLATIKVAGVDRRVVMTMGKLGILDVLDAKTGEYLFSRDMGLQTLVSAIDPKTGDKTYRPDLTPTPNVSQSICPFPAGVRNFPATSFDPSSGLLYVPATESCMNFVWRPQEKDWDIAYEMIPRPDSDGKFGRVAAMDVAGGHDRWVDRGRAGQVSGALATAGGLLFEGTRDRHFHARDSLTGKVLWKTRLSGQPNSYPVSIEAGGRQCVLVTTGGGGPQDASWTGLTPEIETPANSTVLFAFCAP